MSATIGTGITVTFSGLSSFEVIDVTLPTLSVEKIKTSHQGTTSAHTYTPSTLIDQTEAKFECLFDGTKVNPGGTPSSLSIALPNGTTWTWASAFVLSFEPSGNLEELMKVSITVAVSGLPDVS